MSRPYAVDSAMSSPRRIRTSTGNATSWACRAAAARSPSNASDSAARGTAYSISRNRTWRGLQNTAYDGATYSPAAICPAMTRLSRGTSGGASAATRWTSPNAPLPSTSSSTSAATRPRPGERRSVRSFVLSTAVVVCGNQ